MKLKEVREKKPLTVEELGTKAKVSPSMISDIEEGRARPSQITGNKIAKALEIRPDQIEELTTAYQVAWESKAGYLGPR
jgi:transcriptional regulator with XRE-family HTH domain